MATMRGAIGKGFTEVSTVTLCSFLQDAFISLAGLADMSVGVN